MNSIIESQGPKHIDLTPGNLSFEVCSNNAGFVTTIDNFQLAKIARLAGAPMDKKAGVELLKKVGDAVEQNEPLYRIYAEFPADFQFATRLAKDHTGYTTGSEMIDSSTYFEI